jgi:hypothetical protein
MSNSEKRISLQCCSNIILFQLEKVYSGRPIQGILAEGESSVRLTSLSPCTKKCGPAAFNNKNNFSVLKKQAILTWRSNVLSHPL